MLKVYGSPICSGCVAVKKELEERGIPFEFVDITASIPNLRAFLKLRDTREELRAAKEEGRVCIPTFELEDGTITMDEEMAYASQADSGCGGDQAGEAPAFCCTGGHC